MKSTVEIITAEENSPNVLESLSIVSYCFNYVFVNTSKKFFLLVALHPFTYDVWHMDVYIFKIVVKLPTPKKIY